MMAQANRTCAASLEIEQRAVEGAKDGPATFTCFTGLCDTAVPIKLGERTIGFLQTGQEVSGRVRGGSKRFLGSRQDI